MATHLLDWEEPWTINGHSQWTTQIVGDRDASLDCRTLVISGGYCDVYAQAMQASAAYDIPVGEFVWLSFDGACSATNQVAFTGGRLVAKSPAATGTVVALVRSNDAPLSNLYLPDTSL